MNTTVDDQTNWPKLRNAIRRRLKQHWTVNHLPFSDLPDAIQDACGFAVESIQRGVEPGLAIFRACGRVKRGQTLTYTPANRAAWEETPDWTRSPNGVGQATRRASRGLPIMGRTDLH